MISDTWRFIFASVAGTSHAATGAPCQDASICKEIIATNGSSILVAALADGAGTASHSETASKLACNLFVESVDCIFHNGGTIDDITHDFVKSWVTKVQNEIGVLAAADELSLRDFACTFLAAVIGPNSAAFCQIGDGAIVISSRRESEEYQYVFWPQQGDYANITNFVTDDMASNKLEHTITSETVDEVALFSDGLQSLALHYESKTAYCPFFRPVFSWLREAPGGHSTKHSSSLNTYLNSSKVNERTDDDKTLIAATRRNSFEVGV